MDLFPILSLLISFVPVPIQSCLNCVWHSKQWHQVKSLRDSHVTMMPSTFGSFVFGIQHRYNADALPTCTCSLCAVFKQLE